MAMIRRGGALIHEKAFVDETAIIGAGCKVWQFAFVVRGARLGANTSFGSGSGIDGSVCGEDCVFAQNVAAGPGFVIGNRVFLGPNVVLANDMFPQASKDGFDVALLLSGERVCGVIEDGASIGANVVILPGVRIGARSMIAAGAVVHRDVKANTLVSRDGEVMPITERMRARRMRFVEGAEA